MRRGRARRLLAAGALLAAVVTVSPAVAVSRPARTPYPGGFWQPPAPTYGVVADKNVLVPMDDGTRLVADVYYPADPKTGARAHGTFPVLLTQTPYSGSLDATNLTSNNGPGGYFVQRGYIFVSFDIRGTGRSLDGEGQFFSPRTAQDGVDMVKWVTKLPGSDGVVGLQGCSYLGQTQLYTAARLGAEYGANQPVKAMIPACIGGDVYRDIYSDNGIPAPAWVGAGLLAGAEVGPTTDAYMVPHYVDSQAGGPTAYDRTFWLDRDHVQQAADIVRARIPALLYDGWLDNGFGGLEMYAALQNAYFGRNPFGPLTPGEPVTARYQAITGEWHHGGGLDYGIELQWYDTWLKHENTGIPTNTSTPLHLWERNRGWVSAASYPMTDDYTRFYLGAGGVLTAQRARTGESSLRWGLPSESGTSVTYESSPITAGATIAGPSAVTVEARSTAPNLELMADLYDVARNGVALQITHGGLLGSLRRVDAARSWRDAHGLPMRPFLALKGEAPVPVGNAVEYSIPLQPTVWSLAPGHRLELRLSTQADPQVCLNKLSQVEAPVLGCAPRAADLAQLAGSSYTILLTGNARSAVTVPMLRYHALPAASSSVTPTSAGVALPTQW